MEKHGRLRIAAHVEPMFAENGYVVWVDGASAAWVIDPGFAPQPGEILRTIERNQLTPETILLTHCHVDHIAGIAAIRAKHPNVPLIAPRDEAEMLANPFLNLSAAIGEPVVAPEADRTVAAGDTLRLGELVFEARDVAGHSPGGLAYYCAEARVVISGDALFAGSIGRTDFPGSSLKRLLQNIAANLLTLPDETAVYSGHGPATTIGEEQRENPFVGERAGSIV
jgi:hydroxyacylglutathione hydrolase